MYSTFEGTNGETINANETGETGYVFAVFSIVAENISGTDDFSANALKWVVYDKDDKRYEANYHATYNSYGSLQKEGDTTIPEDEMRCFPIVFKVPLEKAEILSLDYESGCKVVRNEGLVVDETLLNPNARN